ncbi:MAG: hypothetical protein ACI4WW_09250 [Candidatus Coprovivens sp.]
MNEIKEANTMLVKRELEEMLGIIKSLKENKDSSKLSLGINCYLILIVIEALNYVENDLNLSITYKFKSSLKSSRARIKPYDSSYDEMLKNITKLNEEKYDYFSSLCNPITKILFPRLIDNIGITLYKGKIIDNTFLDEIDNKKIIITNGKYDSSKTFEIGKEVGSLIIKILNQIDGNDKKVNLNINETIFNNDYNVYYQQNNLFKCDLEVNYCLLLLNALCSLNYYKYLIREFSISNSLKYRIAYIVFSRTFNNLYKITEKNGLISILTILKKYDYLNDKKFRNKIFHYDIYNEISANEFNKNDIYLGLTNKIFKITEKEYIEDIDNYIDDVSTIIEQTIFNYEKEN